MLPEHRKVLEYLDQHTYEDGELCVPFAPICESTRLSRARVRFICRALRRKGLAEFHSALWTEEGYPAGAGYCISKAGVKALEGILE